MSMRTGIFLSGLGLGWVVATVGLTGTDPTIGRRLSSLRADLTQALFPQDVLKDDAPTWLDAPSTDPASAGYRHLQSLARPSSTPHPPTPSTLGLSDPRVSGATRAAHAPSQTAHAPTQPPRGLPTTVTVESVIIEGALARPTALQAKKDLLRPDPAEIAAKVEEDSSVEESTDVGSIETWALVPKPSWAGELRLLADPWGAD